jgi:hypothetical protein
MPLEGFDDAELPEKRPNGRPRAEIDLDMVRNAAGIGCTVNEIAAVLGVTRSTLYKYMALNPAVQDAIDEGRDKGAATLRRQQWHKAHAGSDTMLIWLGKQMLGQRDRSEVTGADGNPIVTEVVYRWSAPEQIAAPVNQIEGKAE